jgi:aryl-alcohol dehydrogenase-like predicted oxidoreductase
MRDSPPGISPARCCASSRDDLANRPTAPLVTVNSIEQLQDSLTAAGFRLSDEEMDALNELSDWEKA